MGLHGGSRDPVVSDILVPRAQARTRNEIIEKLSLCLPIGGVLGLGYREIVSIWRQTVLGLICLDLLLGASQEEGTARVLDVKRDPLFLKVSEGVEKIALRRPSMWSAEIGNNMHIEASAIASVLGRHVEGL